MKISVLILLFVLLFVPVAIYADDYIIGENDTLLISV